jgi:hypothetical protein
MSDSPASSRRSARLWQSLDLYCALKHWIIPASNGWTKDVIFFDVNVPRHIADLVSRKIVEKKDENMSSFLDHSKIEVPYESE